MGKYSGAFNEAEKEFDEEFAGKLVKSDFSSKALEELTPEGGPDKEAMAQFIAKAKAAADAQAAKDAWLNLSGKVGAVLLKAAKKVITSGVAIVFLVIGCEDFAFAAGLFEAVEEYSGWLAGAFTAAGVPIALLIAVKVIEEVTESTTEKVIGWLYDKGGDDVDLVLDANVTLLAKKIPDGIEHKHPFIQRLAGGKAWRARLLAASLRGVDKAASKSRGKITK